jgi:hypothetical protein
VRKIVASLAKKEDSESAFKSGGNYDNYIISISLSYERLKLINDYNYYKGDIRITTFNGMGQVALQLARVCDSSYKLVCAVIPQSIGPLSLLVVSSS